MLVRLTLLLVSTLTVLAGVVIAPILPRIADHQSTSMNVEFWVQLSFVAPSLSVVIFSNFVGKVINRFNSGRLLVVSLAAYGISGAYGYFSVDLLGLLLSRLVLGVSVAFQMVLVLKLISDVIPEQNRASVLGQSAAFGAFGGVLYTFLSSAIATQYWSVCFLLHLIAWLLIPFCWVSFATNSPVEKSTPSSAFTSTKRNSAAFINQSYLIAFVEMLLLYSLPVFLLFYTRNLGLDESGTQSSFSITIMLLSLAITAMFYGRLVKKASPFNLQLVGLFILASGFIGLSQIKSMTYLMPILVFLGLGFGIIRPNLTAWIMMEVAPTDRAQVFSRLVTFYFLGQLLAPLVFNTLLMVHWLSNVYAWSFVLCLAMMVVLLLLKRRAREQVPSVA